MRLDVGNVYYGYSISNLWYRCRESTRWSAPHKINAIWQAKYYAVSVPDVCDSVLPMKKARRKVIFEHCSLKAGRAAEVRRIQHRLGSHNKQSELPPDSAKMAFATYDQDDVASELTSMNLLYEHEHLGLQIPSFLREPPRLVGTLSGATSKLQATTVEEVMPFLLGLQDSRSPFDPFLYKPNGVLELQEDVHTSFLHDALSAYPGTFVALDASRPWMVYWGLSGLQFLSNDISNYRDQIVKTFMPLQNPGGGYGGGQGHLSHLACSYSALLSLACAGGRDAWSLTDRRAMWEWLGRLKNDNGAFAICEGGEQDCRGAYCALVIIALLDLPWELPPSAPARSAGMTTFGDGLGDWLSRCQTYEGGISASPGNEAHGAYTFCAIACLSLLDRPDRSLKTWLDVDALVGWLSARQYAPEGGLAGRTNKVVDACYSQWIGGCWPLVQAALAGPQVSHDTGHHVNSPDLYSTGGLARYILNCCQHPQGGLRDKPSKRPDSYHSCYALAGLSTTQHHHYFIEPPSDDPLASSFSWRTTRKIPTDLGTGEVESHAITRDIVKADELNAVHPIFVIPHSLALDIRGWSEQQERLV